jgi:hypothetical protein
MTPITLGFSEFTQRNPCAGCPAPCCRIQLVSYKVPATFADVDHIRYMLQFPHTEIVSTADGLWWVLKWETCMLFAAGTCTCTVHNTPAKPMVCTNYNAFDCWYKKNFVTEQPPNIYRLSLARFDVWVRSIRFDEDGRIVEAPSFEQSQLLVQGIPIEPMLYMLPGETLAGDIRAASQ